MQLESAKKLIEPAFVNAKNSETWADLGCGDGLFTQALAYYLPASSIIYAIDSNQATLKNIQIGNEIKLRTSVADFEKDAFELEPLDGLLMANSIHYVKNKTAFVDKAKQWLKPNGQFLLIEYDMDKANRWVVYPLPLHSAAQLFKSSGFKIVEKIGMLPSIYQPSGIYALVAKLG